jgi:hypothetical protein
MTPVEKPTDAARSLAVGRGKSSNLGLVALEYISWNGLVAMSSEPLEASISHTDFMALPKPERNRLKKAPFVSFGVFEGGVRNKNTVASRSAAQLDYDEQTLDLFRRLEETELTGGVVPFAYVGHTTRSHTDDAPRLRLMVPFSRDVTPAEYPLCVRALHNLFGAPELDEGSLEPSRLMYLPVINKKAPFWCWQCFGDGYVDPDYLIKLAVGSGEGKPADEEPSDLDIALADKPKTFSQNVNALAMKALGAWVPALFPAATPSKQGGFRVTSESLGRELEEDISIVPEGIKDFGVADLDDPKAGKRSPIALVMEWSKNTTAEAAANWLCKQLGVKPEALGAPAVRESTGAAFVQASEFASAQKVDWHIKYIIQKKGLVIVYGDPGSSKSFFVLDMVAHIARGLPWREHRVKQSKVAYIAAEGVTGFGNRLAAYAKHHDIPLTDLPVFVRGGAMDLKREFLEISQQVIDLGAQVVVIDTLAAVTPGSNENTSEDMGAAIDAAQRIIEATGATVILIHHTNKAGDIRGWSGVGAAVDNKIRIERKDDLRTAHIEKQKEGKDGQAFGYKLVVVHLYDDDDGDPVTSCAVEECVEEAPNTRGAKKERKSRSGDFETSMNYDKARHFLRIIQDMCGLETGVSMQEDEVIEAIQKDEKVNPMAEPDYPLKKNIVPTLRTLALFGKISKEGRNIRLC